MRVQGQASPSDITGLGIAFAAAGLYFMAGAGGMLPMPDVDGPAFIVFLAGAAFMLAGGVCVAKARNELIVERPAQDAGAPDRGWLVRRALAIGGTGALALVGSFAAIGSGPRAFDFAKPLAEMPTIGDQVGRTLFALGATIAWIYLLALAVGTARAILDRAEG